MSDRSLDVVTFGETMLRLSSSGFGRLEESVTLDVRVGGSESNTAVALARLGMRVAWWSKLPATPLGRRIENEIRRWRVATDNVIWDETPSARAGVYYLDFGVPPRGIDVYYDRAASSASKITTIEIDVGLIASSRLLHLTGITPALSPYCSKAVAKAIAVANEHGTKVSFDTNFRSRLWSAETARRELEPLIGTVDLLLCPQSDAEVLFNIKGTGPEVAAALRDRYEIETVVVTCGEEGASAIDDSGAVSVPACPSSQVVDRVGRGDAFNAGVLMGYLQDDLHLGMRYGAAMAALKQTMPGDLLLSSLEEIQAALRTGDAGISR